MDALLVASTLLVVVILAAVGFGPAISEWLHGRDPGTRKREVRRMPVYDPGRERRAERRARELLRSILPPHEYAMYVELGLVRVLRPAAGERGGAYGYLIYPHRPIVAYDAATGELLSEYCVRFPDRSEPAFGERLPDADDVLAKWMALHGDERGLIEDANLHLPGRQLDPAHVRRDLVRLAEWEAGVAEPDGVSRPGAGTRAATA
jgi:hypothetical protein